MPELEMRMRETMSTCWACSVVEPRRHLTNLVIRAHPSALEDLSVMICLECQIKVRRTLNEIQDDALRAASPGGESEES